MKPTAFADEKGDSLVEILVSVAVIAIVITAFLAALSAGVFGVATVRERVTAENLARAQLEAIKNYTYTVGAIVDNPIPEENDYLIIEHPEEYPISIDISYWYSCTRAFTTTLACDCARQCDVDCASSEKGCCCMQWITVTVSHDGESVFTVADYKLNR